MRLSKSELEDAAGVLFEALCSGITDDEAAEDLGVDRPTYDKIKAKMFDIHADVIRKMPVEHIFVQYILDQTANIRDLTSMIGEFKATKQYNAMVGAIRTRSEIQDKIISRGQEFGLIDKTPEKKQIVAGIVIREMSNSDIKRAALRELSDLNKLMAEAGDADMLDVEVGEVHRGPALPPPSEPDRAIDVEASEKPKRPKKKAKKAKAKKQRM